MLPDLAKHSEKLLYFYEIANEGSLQATARRLGTSAPSLSHAVKQLEAVVGAPLFHRSKRGVTLTGAGVKLLVFCRRYFRDMEEVQRLITFPQRQSPRRIKVGTFQSIALYFWPLLMESLKENSRISLSMTTNRSKGILESLIRREIDIALTVGVLKHEKLVIHELYRDEYSFYATGKTKRTTLKRTEIADLPILYIPDATDENGKTLRQYLHSWDLIFRDEFELDSLEVIAEFTKRDYGIGILPTQVARAHLGALKPVRVEGANAVKFGTHRFFLSYRNDLDIPQSLVTRILDSARKAVARLNQNPGRSV